MSHVIGEPQKEGRRPNARQPKNEQERSGATPDIRLLNGAAVALVVRSAACSLADESGLAAVPFQQPGAATESEALQLRGHDVAVAHGAYCVAWRGCPVRGQATGMTAAAGRRQVIAKSVWTLALH